MTQELKPCPLNEGIEILENLQNNIRIHGNYSAESTVLFISQALMCFREYTRTPEPAPVDGLKALTDVLERVKRIRGGNDNEGFSVELWGTEYVELTNLRNTLSAEGVHLNHCYRGEYEDTCKYGDKDCPATPQAPNDDVKATSMQRLEVGKDQWGAPLFVMGTPNAIYALKSKGDLLEQCVKALREVKSYIQQDGQHVRDLYPVFGLAGSKIREMVNEALAAYERKKP